MTAAEQTVSALLRGLVLPRRAPPGPSTTPPAPATTELRLVQPLDDFTALVSQHTGRLPPVVCPFPTPATPEDEEDGFRATVLRPVRVAAGVLAAIGELDAARGLANADPGQLLFCEGPQQRPRMLVLVAPLATLPQNEVSPLSSQIAEACRKCGVRHFAVTDYAQWVFGCLSEGYGSAWLSPPIANDSTQPTAVEALCYWMEQSLRNPQEVASPPTEPATAPTTTEDSVAAPAPAMLQRRPSSSAAVRPPDPDENAKPRTSPRKRKLAEEPKRKLAEEPKRREEQDGDALAASPSKRRRAAEEPQEEAEPPATPRKRRVGVADDGPGPARPSPTKVPLPESPSPRKRSPRKAASNLPTTQEEPSTSTATLAAPDRPNAFITPPTSVRPTEPPPAPAPFSSPVRPPTGSRESPSPRRRRKDDDDDVLVLPASPRKRKAGAADDADELEGSPRKRRTAAAPEDDGSPRKRRTAAPVVADASGSPRKRRTKAA